MTSIPSAGAPAFALRVLVPFGTLTGPAVAVLGAEPYGASCGCSLFVRHRTGLLGPDNARCPDTEHGRGLEIIDCLTAAHGDRLDGGNAIHRAEVSAAA